ncbi:MAG: N-acetylmuramoyl-L-alanine amidase [Pseudolabrys sp.]|nr:N-acetylmuramoyl-L-alanine amidase [Pseudolabrys sp.]
MQWSPMAERPAFMAETYIAADVVSSSNFDERIGAAPDMILLHYTGMQDGQAALKRLCAPDSKVSAHYVVFEDGHTVQCVLEGKRAWHAGASSWAGETDINSRSIGIEIVNPGHEFGYPKFPLRQIAAVIALCRSIMTRHTIPADRVLGHSDVAPSRKQDPGEKFPWELLHESNVGHWVRPAPLSSEGPSLKLGETSEAVRHMQRRLRDYGYGVDDTGSYGEETRIVVAAFQRHFRPERIDGVADASTLLTLRALLDTRPPPLG